jgi:hypothetical protein
MDLAQGVGMMGWKEITRGLLLALRRRVHRWQT